MSDEDIDKAVKEAQRYQSEDKKRKEAVEVKNNADQLIYQSEKILKESKDKISEQEKSSIESSLEQLKQAVKTDNLEEIKAKHQALQNAVYAVSEKIYKAASAAGSAQGDAAAGSAETGKKDDVVDVDYTDVEDDKK